MEGYKKQILAITVLAVTSFFIGMLFLCRPDSALVCRGSYSNLNTIFSPFSLAVFLSVLPLFFLKEIVYYAWRKFAMVALPIVVVIILLASASEPSGFSGFASPGFDREVASMTLAGLFLALSWLIILVKALKSRAFQSHPPAF